MKKHRKMGLATVVAAIAASAVLAAPVGAAKAQISVVCGSGAPGGTVATVSYPAGTASFVFTSVTVNGTTTSATQVPRPKANAGTAVFSNGSGDTVTSLTVEGFAASGKSLGTVSCNF